VISALRTFDTGPVLLGVAGHLREDGLIQTRHSGTQGEGRTADAEALSVRIETHGRLGAEFGRRVAGALQLKRRAIVKQPAWAAAMSSSGLVPFSFSKRVLKE